jgi:hypothetical protein
VSNLKGSGVFFVNFLDSRSHHQNRLGRNDGEDIHELYETATEIFSNGTEINGRYLGYRPHALSDR